MADIIKEPPHYTKWKIEPITFIMENNIPFGEANVIKYVMRWRDKNGIQDLEKAKRYIDMIIEKEIKDKDQLNLFDTLKTKQKE
jgi:hypothetical protein|tara:strand:+ start:19 stop:270 length:252 start_codon:yes stop_codon:yes gene_type:complete